MIQRIQSLYLVLAAACSGMFVVLSESWEYLVTALGEWAEWAIMAIAVGVGLVSLVGVFFYKDRGLQLRVVQAAQWMMLVLVLLVVAGIGVASFYLVGAQIGVSEYLIALFPIAGYVLLRFGRQGIQKDIDKIKSMDRLR